MLPNPYSSRLRPDTPTADLFLSVRASTRLARAKIATVHQLASARPRDLLSIEGFGRKCLLEVADKLQEYFAPLTPSQLAIYAGSLALWRVHLPRPDRISQPAEPPEEPGTPATPEVDLGRPWQSQLPIADLPISARAFNSLTRAAIRDLDELALTRPEELLLVRGCGRRTVRDLAEVVAAYLDSAPPSRLSRYRRSYTAWQRSRTPGGPACRPAILPASEGTRDAGSLRPGPPGPALMQLVALFMEKLGPKRKEIVAERLGLTAGGPGRTLESIGRERDLTRERIRQVVAAALKLLAKMVRTARQDLYPQVVQYLQRAGAAPLGDIVDRVPSLGQAAQHDPGACVRMLLLANPEQVHPLDRAGQLWAASETITPEFYRKVLRAANRALGGASSKLEDLTLEVAKALGRRGKRDIRAIRHMLRSSPAVLAVDRRDKGEVISPSSQNVAERRRSFAYDYIRDQGVPIHILELLSAMQEYEPGLAPDSPSRGSALNTLRSSLERDDRFAWAGPGIWALRDWGYHPSVASIADAAVELLRGAGGPLRTAEIARLIGQLYRVRPGSVAPALKGEFGKRLGRDRAGRWHAAH